MGLFSTKKILLLAAAILPLATLQANPGFSRQMGMSCMACHNQTINQLNTFGRRFSASGFTMALGSQSMIDGDTIKLGLPSALNASILLKARYQKFEPEISKPYEDIGTERGNLELWKVSKLYFGGKVAENVGALLKVDYAGFGGKAIFSYELGSGYAGISAFSDDDFGPFGGGESYNTGLYPPLRLFESRKSTNAAQASEIGHGPATGIQAYYNGDVFSVMGGAYVPASSEFYGLDVGSSAIPIGRLTITPPLDQWISALQDWTFMLGAYGLSGTAALSNDALDNVKPSKDSYLMDITREAFGLDAQIEGSIGRMSTVFALNAVLHNKTELFNGGTGLAVDDFDGIFTDGKDYKAGDNSAYSAELQVNPWEKLGVKIAYLYYNDKYDYRYTVSLTERDKKIDKFDRDEYTIGLDYVYRQNIRFVLEYTYSDIKDDDRTISSLSDSDNYLLSATIGF